LTRKIRKGLEDSLNSILFEIREIKDQHRFLESAARQEGLTEEQIYRRKKTEKNRNRRRRNPNRRRREGDNQESFSF
jgi:hypothetical protein